MGLGEELVSTDIGLIPKTWEVVKLAEIANVRTGPFGSSLHASDYVLDGTPIITVEHLSEAGIVHENLPLVSDTDRQRLRAYTLRKDDIVFSRVGSVDRNSIISERENGWLFSGRLLRIRVSETRASGGYLSYYFHSNAFKERIRNVAVGQTMASLNTKIISDIQVALPPLPEQRAIAEVLSDVDGHIATLEALIAKKRAIMQGAMQELLTARRRLPGFTGEWEIKKLGEVARMASGGTPLTHISEYYDGDIPWVSISDMTSSQKYIKTTYRNLTQSGLAHSAAKVFPVGTVLYAMYASLGECSIAGVPLCTSQAILGISTNSELSSEYLYYYLDAIKSKVRTIGQHGTQSNLNKQIVEDFDISLPDFDEQEAICQIFIDMHEEIDATEQLLLKTRNQKEGLMQELLTGKTRLI